MRLNFLSVHEVEFPIRRSTFVVIALLAVLLGMRYWSQLGETHGADKRAPLSISAILKTYGELLRDRRFIAPALSVSLLIGSLYMFLPWHRPS